LIKEEEEKGGKNERVRGKGTWNRKEKRAFFMIGVTQGPQFCRTFRERAGKKRRKKRTLFQKMLMERWERVSFPNQSK